MNQRVKENNRRPAGKRKPAGGTEGRYDFDGNIESGGG